MKTKCNGNCNVPLVVLDSCGHSATMQCPRCRSCALVIDGSRGPAFIPLKDFHLKRGDGDDQRPLDDLGMADRLVADLRADHWPSAATMIDYGIESTRHLGALQHAVACGVTAYELDRVMGDGVAITQLVNTAAHLVDGAAHQTYMQVNFQTAYDSSDLEEEFAEE